jgi:hypothetical protein
LVFPVNIREATTKGFNVENYIQKLAEDETIPFEVIDLKNLNILFHLY